MSAVMDEAADVARRIVQVANSPDLGDVRGDVIRQIVGAELMVSDPFAKVRAGAVVTLLGEALVTLIDAFRDDGRDPAAVDDGGV